MHAQNSIIVRLNSNVSNSIWEYNDKVELNIRETNDSTVTVSNVAADEFLTAIKFYLKRKVENISELPAAQRKTLGEIAEFLQEVLTAAE